MTSISDLPQGTATLKVIQNKKKNPDSSVDSQLSDSSLDTIRLCSGTSPSSPIRVWPNPFIIPRFSSNVELQLKQGNEAYLKDGTLLNISKDMKSDILDRIVEAFYAIKSCPSGEAYNTVAEALTDKHPCLKQPGSSFEWYGWKFSLMFKMRILRQKLQIAGCSELSGN